MSGNIDVLTICLLITVPLFLMFVIVPWFKLLRAVLPTVKEWKDISGKMPKLTADNIQDNRWSGKSKDALKLVLVPTMQGGGRLSNVPMALDTIYTPYEHAESEYRALSSQSIVLGLLGTVVTFALVFYSEKGTPNPAALLKKLSTVYFVNSIALGFGAGFFYKHRKVREQGGEVVSIAQSAFAQLQDTTASSLGPELAAAFDRTATKLESYSRQLFEDQFQSISSLLREVGGVGEALRSLVNQVVEQAGSERESIRATVRENAASVERLTERLDEGFKLLAQPFLQGIPAMESLTKSADTIRDGARAGFTEFSEAISQMRIFTAQLEKVAADIPQQAERIFSEAGGRVVSQAAEALGQAVSTHMTPQVQRLADTVESASSSLAQSSASMGAAARELSDSQLSQTAHALRQAAEEMAIAVRALPEQAERLYAKAPDGIVKIAGQVISDQVATSLVPCVQKLIATAESFGPRLTEHSIAWWKAFEGLERSRAEADGRLRRDLAEISTRLEGGLNRIETKAAAIAPSIEAAIEKWIRIRGGETGGEGTATSIEGRVPAARPGIMVAGRNIQLDAKGCLVNPDDWSEDVAVALAEKESVTLTPEQCTALVALRDIYRRYQTRWYLQFIPDSYGEDKSFRDMFRSMGQACRFAGLPWPGMPPGQGLV